MSVSTLVAALPRYVCVSVFVDFTVTLTDTITIPARLAYEIFEPRSSETTPIG
jgi:hypothetical protein